jgi:hypothetical protein
LRDREKLAPKLQATPRVKRRNYEYSTLLVMLKKVSLRIPESSFLFPLSSAPLLLVILIAIIVISMAVVWN